MRVPLLLCVAFGAVCFANFEASALSPEEAIAAIEAVQDPDGQGLDRLTFAEAITKSKVPGVSVAVIQDFTIHWAKAYGVADVETGRAVDTETLFQAASISKPVSAMAVLKAVEMGKFGLDDDINTLLTSWTLPENEFTAERKVTPAMLLSHTGGTTIHGYPGYHPTKVTIPTAVQVLEGGRPARSLPVRVDTVPGTIWRYSGGGTTIMQVAMVDVMGLPFPEIIKTLVLDPIGMTHSGYDQPLTEARQANDTRAHNARGGKMSGKWHVYPEMAAAGNWTTPTDLCAFAIEVQLSLQGKSNKVLSREMIEKMVTSRDVGNYGLGFFDIDRNGARYFGHGGSNWGYICNLVAHRNDGYGLVIMTNGDRGGLLTQEFLKRVAKAYGWAGHDADVDGE